MPQAQRIKPESPAVRVGIIRFFKGVLRESSFWLAIAIALGMIIALASFHSNDPAWTHTGNFTKIQNLGGTVGAWFADITLYFFGYPAYFFPLGLSWAGWRLFKRGALLELDAEIVLFRVLGFAVALLTACGVATLHLHTAPGTVPGAGSAGGLVGVHVSQFLTRAFGFGWGNLFMVALLFAGVTLTTGLSWLKLLDWIGSTVLNTLSGVGSQPKSPPKRGRAKENGEEKPPAEIASSKPAIKLVKDNGAALKRTVFHWLDDATTKTRAWWQARRLKQDSEDVSSATESAELAESLTANETPSNELGATAPNAGARNSARVEPVLNLPRKHKSQSGAARPPDASPSSDPSKLALPDLTLIPTAVASPDPAGRPPPASPSPSRNSSMAAPATQPWLADYGFPTEEASNDSLEMKAPLAKTRTTSTTPSPPLAAMARRLAPAEPASADVLPSLDLLDQPPVRTAGYSSATLEQMSRHVESLLKSFGIDARVVAVEPGPVITRFEVDPAPGVKVSQISNLAKDLARGLSVVSVRVVEVIPGKSVIGLEIPNRHREVVYLREVLEAPVYTESASPLTLALGMDIGGKPVVANLAKMPHLLVAGTTGSGKSVAINAMLLSLLYKAPPTEVRLILVDPKMLELSMYEDIPHLLTPVVTDMKEAANALRWCVGEMERRYRLMAALKVRNITGFNRKILDALEEGGALTDPFWKPDGAMTPGEIPLLQPLPSVVVVIDELADMMMIVGKKVEELIARLAQKARASGIHLILATQRPSVDVITGLIKANIPTRIAFQVSSKVDSRTILDQMGAEQLLGHGDMLYLPPGTGLPQRVHGAFVDDQEVNRVVDFLRQTGSPDYIDDVLVEAREDTESSEESETSAGRGGESDPLYDEAVRIVTESRRASVSGVQRRLRIGYNRAARLVEEMEVAGVVGPLQSNGSREVLAPPPP